MVTFQFACLPGLLDAWRLLRDHSLQICSGHSDSGILTQTVTFESRASTRNPKPQDTTFHSRSPEHQQGCRDLAEGASETSTVGHGLELGIQLSLQVPVSVDGTCFNSPQSLVRVQQGNLVTVVLNRMQSYGLHDDVDHFDWNRGLCASPGWVVWACYRCCRVTQSFSRAEWTDDQSSQRLASLVWINELHVHNVKHAY